MTPTPDWDPRTCNERSGFLFQHDCGSLPDSVCSQCGKPICQQHTHFLDNESYCTSCVKLDYKQRRSDQRRLNTGGPAWDDDPYFYSDRHYDGYGHYRPGSWGYVFYSSHRHDHDFTAADGESMTLEGDGDFESDMSES